MLAIEFPYLLVSCPGGVVIDLSLMPAFGILRLGTILLQQKLSFASCVSCVSDAHDTPDVNCDSRGNVTKTFRPEAIPSFTLRPGAILTLFPASPTS